MRATVRRGASREGWPEASDLVARWLQLSQTLLDEVPGASAGTRIHFRCTNPTHLIASQVPSGLVTAHDGRWAYCNDPVAASPHRWEVIGGVDVNLLRIEQRRRLQVRAARPIGKKR